MIMGICYLPKSSFLATTSGDGALRLWDTVKGTETVTRKVSEDGAKALAVSPDGQWLAVGTGNLVESQKPSDVKLWKVSSIINKDGKRE